MAEIIYHYNGKLLKQDETDIRWLSRNDLEIFNHLLMCGQKTLSKDAWNQIYDDGTIYCLLFLKECLLRELALKNIQKQCGKLLMSVLRNAGETRVLLLKYACSY